MAHVHGSAADITWSGTTIVGAHEYSITETVDVEEVTDTADNPAKTYIIGNKDWTATVTANLDDATAPLTVASSNTAIELIIKPDGTDTITGSGFVTSVNPSAGVNSKWTVTYEIQGSGALVYSFA